MGNPNITDRAKQEIFTKAYGKFDKGIFSKIVKVTTDSEEAANLTNTYSKGEEPPADAEPVAPAEKQPDDDAEKKRQLIAPLLKKRIVNPKTKQQILVGTALKYDKNEPVYKSAVQFIKQSINRGINVEPQ